jgi:hypothetical protein
MLPRESRVLAVVGDLVEQGVVCQPLSDQLTVGMASEEVEREAAED